ncbi:MAG: hypothetical protein J3R72DRAFT_65807 [Linnemannia gamsii]|nr:MAG: hypothetical protein J3R72DRAFT_65807 [Linnemannia gamsii]
MRSFTAEVACYFLTSLIVLLCRTATTTLSSVAFILVDAHPIHTTDPSSLHIQRRQDPTINNAIIPSGPALSTPSTGSQTSTSTPVIQKPLIQIIAPNVTLFAVLDLPSTPSSTPSSPPSSPSPSPSPDNENDPGSSSTPLLLPTSSLTILPSQIYHVNDSLIFGAGGSEPLTVMHYVFFSCLAS